MLERCSPQDSLSSVDAKAGAIAACAVAPCAEGCNRAARELRWGELISQKLGLGALASLYSARSDAKRHCRLCTHSGVIYGARKRRG